MAERKTIHVYVTCNWEEYIRQYRRVAIPADIDEVELKATLRDLGYIPSNMESYRTTKVYLDLKDGTDDRLKEICTDEYRTLGDLGIGEGSLIVIKKGKPEPEETRVIYRERGSMRYLYGCPMAQSVEEAMSRADSVVSTGYFGID